MCVWTQRPLCFDSFWNTFISFGYLFNALTFDCQCQSMCKTSVKVCLLSCVGGFTVWCPVKVMVGSWMHQPQGEDEGVWWGAGILSAAGLLSRLLHSCRQTVCKNSWPGCLGAEWRIKQEVDKEEEIERDRQWFPESLSTWTAVVVDSHFSNWTFWQDLRRLQSKKNI